MADEELLTAIDWIKGRGIPPWKAAEDVWKCESYRIEALRAASRIVAGILSNSDVSDEPINKPWIVSSADAECVVFDMAEQFARWLEGGKR